MSTAKSAAPRGARGGFRSRLGQLNPAFAAAHGISPAKSPSAEEKKTPPNHVSKKETEENAEYSDSPASPTVTEVNETKKAKEKKPSSKEAQTNHVIGRARATGKLNAADSGLETPMPTILFEFPSLVDSVDISMYSNPDNLKPWESHLAETLTVVDFSDNEITEFPKMNTTDTAHISDNSVERYRAVQIFRARRCKLQAFPMTKTMKDSWQSLTTLDLSGNQLTGEFPLLYLPNSIRELDISNNLLASLKSKEDPSTSIDLPQLMSLDISNNEISSTGISPVMNLPNLQRLTCGNNKLSNLNFIMKSLSSSEKTLTTLQAPRSMISDLDGRQPIDLTGFVSLLSVDLSENSLCQIPKIPSTLQRLNVNHNHIRGIRGLLKEDGSSGEYLSSSLVVLQAQYNKIAELDPATVSMLKELNRLDLQFNSLQSLPTELGLLTNLQQMYLEGNHMLSLRSSGVRGDLGDTKNVLAKLRNRTPLNKLDSNPDMSSKTNQVLTTQGSNSSDGSDSFSSNGSSAAFAKSTSQENVVSGEAQVGKLLSSLLVGAKVLNYEGKHAHMLPYQLLEELKTSPRDIVEKIERLKIAKNQLQTIEEDWFKRLPQLTALEAQDNRITSLPSTIREVGLSSVFLSRNRLTAHAIQFSLLLTSTKSNAITETLQSLDLSANCLESMPPGLLYQFKSIRTLKLSRNKISSLKNIVQAPRAPSCLTLEHLDLGENRIEDMGGDEFPLLLAAGCPNLQTLLLHNNEMKVVPTTLGLIETLKVLDLRGNPQRFVRYEILEKNTRTILEYLRNRMNSKTREYASKRMKILLSISQEADTDSAADGATELNKENGAKETPKSTKDSKGLLTKEEEELEKDRLKQTKMQNYLPLPSKNEDPPTIASPAKPKTAASCTSKSKMPPPTSRYGRSPASSIRLSAPPNDNSKKPSSATKTTKSLTSPLLEQLEKTIEELAAEMDRPGLSEPKRYAIKKKLAMERSKRLREERRLKQEREKQRDRFL
jgi:Leucine-rich repeat (LRR) protein